MQFVLFFLTACKPSYLGEPPTSGEGVADTGTSPADETGEPETADTGEPEETDSGSADDTGSVDDTGSEDTGTAAEDTGVEPECVTDEDCPSDACYTYFCGAGSCFAGAEVDADGDGYGVDCGAASGGDCDDADATVNPGAIEICNGVDDDCDGSRNEGLTWTWVYADDDGDGYGNGSDTSSTCDDTLPTEYGTWVWDNTDCDDTDATINPGASEIANDGIDQDCDESDLVTETDADGDGYGESTDCDDSNNEVYPGAAQQCRSDIDYDCDGLYLYDDPDAASIINYRDSDGDGYGSTTIAGCSVSRTLGANESYTSDDCDDADATVNPGESEVLDDGIDQDCDGSDSSLASLQDEAECASADACFADVDGDGDYETLLMDGGLWTTSSRDDQDAQGYETGSSCGLNDDTFSVNSEGYYVVSFAGIGSDCSTWFTLTQASDAYWWQNLNLCYTSGDTDRMCVSTGSWSWLIDIEWDASSGLVF